MAKKLYWLAALALLGACATTTNTATAPAAPPTDPTYAPLVVNDQFIGGPPPVGSHGQQWDADLERSTETPERVAQASADQGVNQRPDPFEEFQPVLGADFSAARLPRTAALFAAIAARVGQPALVAKEAYHRDRPFVSDPTYPRCTPPLDDPTRAILGPQRSYPSGHSALGFAWALMMTELMPDRAQALMERGYQFGRSRVICGVHWTSDVESGRLLAAGVVAQAHALPSVQAAMNAARDELRTAGYIH